MLARVTCQTQTSTVPSAPPYTWPGSSGPAAYTRHGPGLGLARQMRASPPGRPAWPLQELPDGCGVWAGVESRWQGPRRAPTGKALESYLGRCPQAPTSRHVSVGGTHRALVESFIPAPVGQQQKASHQSFAAPRRPHPPAPQRYQAPGAAPPRAPGVGLAQASSSCCLPCPSSAPGLGVSPPHAPCLGCSAHLGLVRAPPARPRSSSSLLTSPRLGSTAQEPVATS